MRKARKFTCGKCFKVWETDAYGCFKSCPDCRLADEHRAKEKDLKRRTKECLHCKKDFLDGTQRLVQYYCNEECRRREKYITVFGAPPEGGFLNDRKLICEMCRAVFTPKAHNQKYCSDECRWDMYDAEQTASRYKVCPVSGNPFFDDSIKNNQRFDSQVARERVGHKLDPFRQPKYYSEKELEENRRYQIRSGSGGRIDDIRTLKKYTATWWGRSSELVFATYRLYAKDMVILCGNKSPYDYHDPEFGRVDVKGSIIGVSPHGLPVWTFSSYGLNDSCDYGFFVGYADGKQTVEHLWLIPSYDISESSINLSPRSREYRFSKYEVTHFWGLEIANRVTQEHHALSEPTYPTDPYAWLDDMSNYHNKESSFYFGRMGELLYKKRYPTSRDMNREFGCGYPYDFEDSNGILVDVKTSVPFQRSKNSIKWSFGTGPRQKSHNCDVYSCLCLDWDCETVLDEFRIPAKEWGERRTIHIYADGTDWHDFKTIQPDPNSTFFTPGLYSGGRSIASDWV